jgi:GlpG protein
MRGPRFYLSFFVVVGIASNLAQYLITQNPLFGGLSGLIYGLFGYVWIRGRLDPSFPSMHKNTVIMMLAWYVICWTGIFGQIANWAHTAGLVLGVVWAFAEGRLRR